jgi:hypothetical protein
MTTNEVRTNVGKLATTTRILPNGLKYPELRAAPAGKRRIVRFSPDQQNGYTITSGGTSNIIRFNLPNANIIDFTKGGLAFDLTLTVATPGTYIRVANHVSSIINRVVIRTSQQLEDIRDYNRLYSIINSMNREPLVGAVLGEVTGQGTQFQRNVWGATPNKDYIIPLLCGLFLSSPIPMRLFTEQLVLELYIENPQNCIETDGTGIITIGITNLFWHAEKLELSSDVEAMFLGQGMGYIKFPYKTFIVYNSPILQTGQQDINVPHQSDGIDGIISIMNRTDQASNPTVDDKYNLWPANNITQWYSKINNDFFPEEPIQAGLDPQAYLSFLRFINKWDFGGVYKNPPVISFTAYSTNKFIMINDYQTFRNEGLVNDLSTAQSGNQTLIRMTLNGAPPGTTILISYVMITRTIEFTAGRLRQ